MTWLRSAMRRLATARVPALGLGLLVFVTAFAFAAAPRVLDIVADRTLHSELGMAMPVAGNLELTQVGNIPASGTGSPFDGVRARGEALAAQLPSAVSRVIVGHSAIADSARWTVEAPLAEPATVTFRFQDGAAGRIDLTAGRSPTGEVSTVADPDPPAGSSGNSTASTMTVFEGALSEDAAALLGIGLGDVVPLGLDQTDALARLGYAPRTRWAVRVVGLLRAREPSDVFWYGENGILHPSTRVFGPSLAINDVRVLVDPAAYGPMAAQSEAAGLPLRYHWRSFVDPGAISMADTGPLVGALRQAESIFPRSASAAATPGTTRMTTDLAALLADSRTRWSFAVTVMAAGAAGAAAMAMASLGLVALLAARRRRASVAAWRTRGASTPQVLRATLGEGLVCAIPAAVLATGLAIVLIPGTQPATSIAAGTAVVIAAALAVGFLEIPPALGPKGGARAGNGAGPADGVAGGGAATSRRLAAEIVVVVLAVAAIVLLRGREADAAVAAVATGAGARVPRGGPGAALGGGVTVNPLLALAPTLVAFAAALIVVRLIPVALRGVAWASARRRDLVATLAMRRAARQGGSTAVVLVLFACTAITTFAAVTVQTLDQGADVVAWQQTGADYHLLSTLGSLPPVLVTGSLPGVTGKAPAIRGTAGVATDLGGYDLLAVAMPAYAPLVAGTPGDPGVPAELLEPDPASLPVVLSPALAARTGVTRIGQPFRLMFQNHPVSAHLAALRDWWPTLEPNGTFIVVSLDQLTGFIPVGLPTPTDEFMAAPADGGDALLATLGPSGPGVTLVSRTDVAAAIRDRPVNRAVEIVILGAVLIGMAYAVLALIVGLVLAGSARSNEVGHLRMLGLGRRDPIALLALEYGPVLGATLIVAAGLGIGLFVLLERSLGLGVLLGSPLEIPITLDPAVLLLLLGVGLGLTAISIALAGLLGSRGVAASAIREGIE